jgi:hypothetical protein
MAKVKFTPHAFKRKDKTKKRKKTRATQPTQSIRPTEPPTLETTSQRVGYRRLPSGWVKRVIPKDPEGEWERQSFYHQRFTSPRVFQSNRPVPPMTSTPPSNLPRPVPRYMPRPEDVAAFKRRSTRSNSKKKKKKKSPKKRN